MSARAGHARQQPVAYGAQAVDAKRLCQLRNQIKFMLPTGIAAISKDALDEREQSSRLAQQLKCSITVLNIGGMNDDVQQQTQRVDQDVPLATLDLLARIVARRIEPRPPF